MRGPVVIGRMKAAVLGVAVMASLAWVFNDDLEMLTESRMCGHHVESIELAPLETLGFVAHAGGSPTGRDNAEHYTNSREGFEASYANGFRAFEFDLGLLADGTVVVAHDLHESQYGLDVEFSSAVRAEIEGALWHGKYEIMFGDDLVELMTDYPDAWFILDTKWSRVDIARVLVNMAPDDTVRDRMVPHIAGEDHLIALESVYRFPEKMVAVYQWSDVEDDTLIEVMQRHGVDNVMMWWDSRWSEATEARFEAEGFHVWVHSPERRSVIEDFRSLGVGVYSNGWIECSGA